MSSNQISIKPNNHRVYQCQTDKKLELLNKIISEHEGVNILVACSKEPQTIIDALENKAIKVIEDKDLIKDKELSCEFLISFDLPIKNIVYMARVVKATQKAVMILDENEQKELYQVEMLLGRALKQEVTEGFQYPKIEKKEDYFSPSFFAPIILNIVVPQSGHLPFIALLSTPPFPFIATSLASIISLFALHFTQYASIL